MAVAVDGRQESRDAAVVASTLAGVTDANVMLVAVHPGAPVVPPQEMGWVGVHQRAVDMVHELRDSVLPGAGTLIETDLSVGRALETLDDGDFLIVGSSGAAPLGRVRIDNGTRRLFEQAPCAVIVAPRGLSTRPVHNLRAIGVVYDREPEAREAMKLAGSLARASGATLCVDAALDLSRDPELDSLRADAELTAATLGVEAGVNVTLGSAADQLLARSQVLDLLVIGSRRAGPANRVRLGSTVGALLHAGGCPIVVVPGVASRHGSG
jgi:nucleotide-binding universal stress UspA family protein